MIDDADKLLNLMHTLRLTQTDTAPLLGVARQTVWRWCNRRTRVPTLAFIALGAMAAEAQRDEPERDRGRAEECAPEGNERD